MLMAAATVYEYMNFGLSLQTYAQTFSALVAFFVGEIELRENLLLTHKRLEQANQELKEDEKKVKAALEAEMKMEEELRQQQEQLSLGLAAAQITGLVACLRCASCRRNMPRHWRCRPE